VVFTESPPASRGQATLAEIDAQAREDERREALRRVRNHPRVTEAIDIFKARVKDVRLPPD
jgi:7-keto-8-aminopelargonate synthetase-like enzyme